MGTCAGVPGGGGAVTHTTTTTTTLFLLTWDGDLRRTVAVVPVRVPLPDTGGSELGPHLAGITLHGLCDLAIKTALMGHHAVEWISHLAQTNSTVQYNNYNLVQFFSSTSLQHLFIVDDF
jgi:hypothetical protein